MTAPAAEAVSSRFPLFEHLPPLADRIPRIALGVGPTPVRRLRALQQRAPGGELWIKNDGLYGTVYGGNKPRKLEFVLADAVARRAPAILTTGALRTNHGLATALYGRELGIRVALLLTYEQPVDGTADQLCRMQRAGAALHYTRSLPWTLLSLPRFAWRYRANGRWPYLLMPGGSTALGALGYVNAAFELADQVRAGELPEPDTIVVPVGTGGTAAGLLLGLRLAGLETQLIGVAITRAPTAWKRAVLRLAGQTARLIARATDTADIRQLPLSGFRIETDWLGPGFGQASPQAEEAATLVAESEGIGLDSTYTAKAAAALLALRGRGTLTGPTLYWHTYDALSAPSTFGREDYRRLPPAFHRFCPL